MSTTPRLKPKGFPSSKNMKINIPVENPPTIRAASAVPGYIYREGSTFYLSATSCKSVEKHTNFSFFLNLGCKCDEGDLTPMISLIRNDSVLTFIGKASLTTIKN